MRWRVTLPMGHADVDAGSFVRVGDAMVPTRFSGTWAGVGTAPTVTMDVEVIDGAPQCRDLHFVAVPGDREVRPRDLREVKLDRWLADLTAALSHPVVREDGGRVVAAPPTRASYVKAREAVTSSGRHHKLTRSHLTEVANVYRANLDARPTIAVARAFGVSHRTAASWLTAARQAGLLPATTPGKRKA